MEAYIKKFEPLWGEWKVVEELGEGSYGSVWKVSRDKGGMTEYAAVKEVRVPASEEVWEESKLEGLDVESAKLYFQKILDKTLREVNLMKELAECPNIVEFQKCEIKELDEFGTFGWVIYIKMELLQSVKDVFLNKKLALEDVAKIGIDIAKALEVCEEKGIVHQDIKPDNLFYSPQSDTYKLGDFGIAKQLGRATAQKGRPGTLSYMSPEIFGGAESSSASDLYALGMILYRVLNHFRMPFLPSYPQRFTPDERDQALLGRLKGKEPELPDVSFWTEDMEKAKALAEIARRSISADIGQRYQSAREFREVMEALDILKV